MATWSYNSFSLPEPLADDLVWGALRAQRDSLLAQSDWTQVADAPVDKVAWAQYRQALRELPKETTDPRQAMWPTPPR